MLKKCISILCCIVFLSSCLSPNMNSNVKTPKELLNPIIVSEKISVKDSLNSTVSVILRFVTTIKDYNNTNINLIKIKLDKEIYNNELYSYKITAITNEKEEKKENKPEEPQEPKVYKIEKFRVVGTGYVWNKAGYIVTNNHVVDSHLELPKDIFLRFYSSPEIHQIDKIVSNDPVNDVAVLKIKNVDYLLNPVKRELPHSLEQGEEVWAIGSGLGFEFTVTKGVLSGFRVLKGRLFIQHDAPINPGNSGGPLFDSKGNWIGMNTLIMTRDGLWAGTAFALNGNFIVDIIEKGIRKDRLPEIIQENRQIHEKVFP